MKLISKEAIEAGPAAKYISLAGFRPEVAMAKSPRNDGIGAEFRNENDFWDWYEQNQSNSLELFRPPLTVPDFLSSAPILDRVMCRADVIVGKIDDLFSDPYKAVSFLDIRMRRYDIYFRYRQTIGHVSEKQMFALKWCTLLGWSGFYEIDYEHEAGLVAAQNFCGAMFMEGTPKVDHYHLCYRNGDTFREKFWDFRSTALNHITPEKFDFENWLLESAVLCSKHGGPLGTFARRFVSPSGGWAISR